MALGALFLKVAPCNCGIAVSESSFLASIFLDVAACAHLGTYPLVHVDGVLAGDNVLDGGARGLAGRLLGLGRHGCKEISWSVMRHELEDAVRLMQGVVGKMGELFVEKK